MTNSCPATVSPSDAQHGEPFWAYAAGIVRHPRCDGWEALLAEPRRLRSGFVAVLSVGLGYAACIALIALSGGTPSPPWLAIPRADYFAWEALFVCPVTVLCWILAAGVVHLLGRLAGGQGSFDDTLALLGFAVALPTLISLIPDTARSVLTATGVQSRPAWEAAIARPGNSDWLVLWGYMLGYFLGLFILFPLAVATAQRLHGWPALRVGGAGALTYAGVYLIFIR